MPFHSFREFWPFYVSEHAQPLTRTLHFIGSICTLLVPIVAIATGRLALLVLMPLVGYGFAWVSHFFVEKNRPATFKYPFYSFAADWVMFGKILAGTMNDEVANVRRNQSP